MTQRPKVDVSGVHLLGPADLFTADHRPSSIRIGPCRVTGGKHSWAPDIYHHRCTSCGAYVAGDIEVIES